VTLISWQRAPSEKSHQKTTTMIRQRIAGHFIVIRAEPDTFA